MKKLIMVAAIGALAFAPPSKTELKFNLKPGKVYHQSVTIFNNTKQTAMGQEMEFSSTTSSSTYFERKADADNGAAYDMWYGEMSMEFEGMGQSQKFSSTDTAEGMGSMLGKLTEQKFVAVISHTGTIEEVRGLEELIQKAAGEGEGGDQMSRQISESFGDVGLERNLEFGINIFPEGKVKKGSSWSKSHYSNSGMPVIVENTYTLKAVNGKTAEIEVNGTFSVDPENATGDMQGMEATFFFDGTRTGTLTVEIETGWVISGTLNDDIGGSVTIAANAQVPDGMTVPMELVNTTKISGN
ncbi:MAG: DUF6263 family protein [Cryomorphaceae bacterium]|nr:DUF6263 family protein [Flavobacteriales bacterium]